MEVLAVGIDVSSGELALVAASHGGKKRVATFLHVCLAARDLVLHVDELFRQFVHELLAVVQRFLRDEDAGKRRFPTVEVHGMQMLRVPSDAVVCFVDGH